MEAETEAVLRSNESFILLSISNFIFWKKLLDSLDDFEEQNNTFLLASELIIIKKNFKSGNFKKFILRIGPLLFYKFSFRTKNKSN